MKVKTLNTKSIVSFSAPLLYLSLSACGLDVKKTEAETITQETYGAPVGQMKVDVNENPLHTTVCDPFSENPAIDMKKGVRASLYYLAPGMPVLNKSTDYLQFARKSQQKLFFTDINAPTRLFDKGFSTQTSDIVKTDTGEKLIENFGMSFETVLKLGPEDAEGTYELAMLSDDGVVLKTNYGTNDKVLVNDDGDHPTKMGCSSQLITMKKETSLPLKLSYYQGPRYHIANVMIWRKATTAGKDALCGSSSNDLFYNQYTSAPASGFKDLTKRGWKVVGADNFYLPESATYNPCVQGTNPVISNFRVYEVLLTGVFLNWDTDIPSTSQVKIINKQTGEIILTDADHNLYQQHRVQVMNLQPETTYMAQAVSVSEDLGHTLSSVIEFTTP